VSCEQIIQRRLDLMWGIGAAFTAYVATTYLSGRSVRLASLGQILTGSAIGSWSGALLCLGLTQADLRFIKRQYDERHHRFMATSRRIEILDEELNELAEAVENSQVEVPEAPVWQEGSNSLAFDYAWSRKWSSIGIGFLVGSGLSLLASKVGQEGMVFGQTMLDVGLLSFSISSLTLLRCFHSRMIKSCADPKTVADQAADNERWESELQKELESRAEEHLAQEQERKELTAMAKELELIKLAIESGTDE
jgi:hypothetical protein